MHARTLDTLQLHLAPTAPHAPPPEPSRDASTPFADQLATKVAATQHADLDGDGEISDMEKLAEHIRRMLRSMTDTLMEELAGRAAGDPAPVRDAAKVTRCMRGMSDLIEDITKRVHHGPPMSPMELDAASSEAAVLYLASLTRQRGPHRSEARASN